MLVEAEAGSGVRPTVSRDLVGSTPVDREQATERVAKLVQSNVTPMADKMTFIGDGADVVTGAVRHQEGEWWGRKHPKLLI